MEPTSPSPRQAGMLTRRPPLRLLISFAFAVALLSTPMVQVAACSCVMGDTVAQIRAAPLAFIGTVVGQRETGGRNALGDGMVEYAFDVERASGPTAAVAAVEAGANGGSCGVTFAKGEEWLVMMHPTEMGDTDLCSGNLRLADVSPEERASFEELLPVVPASDPAEASDLGVPVSALLVLGAAVMVGGIGLLAFRRERSS